MEIRIAPQFNAAYKKPRKEPEPKPDAKQFPKQAEGDTLREGEGAIYA